MKPRFMNFVLVTCLLCTVDVSAVAHERHFLQNHERPSREECQVNPGGEGGIDQDRGQVEREPDVLKRCKGILIPPPTGDGEMVEPAPDIGTTPVIPPDSVPEQPSGPDYP